MMDLILTSNYISAFSQENTEIFVDREKTLVKQPRILSYRNNPEIPTKVDCPLINFNVRRGLWLLQIKVFCLRQLNGQR